MLKALRIGLVLLMVFMSNKSEAKPGIGEVFDDWTEFCEVLDSGQESCNIYQTLTLKGEKKPLLALRVQYLSGKNEPVLFVTLPLGVLLTYPAKFELNKQALDMQFQFCESSGCSAAMVLTPPMLKIMSSSKQVLVKFVNLERRLIAIPVSLKGFSRGLAKIQQLQQNN